MASSPPFLLLLPLFFSFLIYPIHALSQISLSQPSVFLPVTRDPTTLQYITQIHHEKPTNLIIDLSAPFLWIDCDSGEPKLPSRRVIPSCSIQCSMAKPFHFGDNNKKHCFFGTHLSSCSLSVQNPISGSTSKGVLVEDVIAVGSKSGKQVTDSFLFACAPTAMLNGLASEAQGILGLGRSPISIPSQLAAKFEFQNKFATCLSNSNGFISFGNMGTNSISGLTYTNLVHDSQDYFINVRAIKINGKRVALGLGQEGIGSRTKISTLVAYTTLESTIYGIFKNAYLKAAIFMNMTRVVPSGAPFDLCFSSKGIENISVPVIDLVLQSEMVKWRIYGRNSMVKVSEDVMCLGILDGGLDSKTSIVIGGFQLEDMLLEFDLGTNMLGFSQPLSLRQASCSDFLLESGVKELM
ncbi:probable aspartic proteinase GIP2 [Euphorbia lathyris]|uniref:probable aspartic proteinase GIP2 n=1 Tax=Euphorbia lathyris TaxID=212925 RepID=UPI003313EDD3